MRKVFFYVQTPFVEAMSLNNQTANISGERVILRHNMSIKSNAFVITVLQHFDALSEALISSKWAFTSMLAYPFDWNLFPTCHLVPVNEFYYIRWLGDKFIAPFLQFIGSITSWMSRSLVLLKEQFFVRQMRALLSLISTSNEFNNTL